MAYKRNDRGNDKRNDKGNERGHITEFRDGQPVYKSGAGKRGGQDGVKSYAGQDGGKRPYGQKRGEEQKGTYGRGPRRFDEKKNEEGENPGNKRGAQRHFGERKPRQEENGGYGRAKQQRYADTKSEADYPFKSAQQQAEEKRGRYSGEGEGFAGRGRRFGRAEETEVQKPLREDELPYILMGRNAVKEAIKSGRSIDRILVQNEPDGSLREILALARDRQLQIREVDRSKLDEMCMPFGHGNKTGNHQGIVAQVPGVQYCELSDILACAKERGEQPFVVLLDGIEDPYNLGSILRSAECAGAHGVVIPKRRAAGVTSSACKAAAGAAEYIKVAQVSNLSGAIAVLKEKGLWIAGADMTGAPMEQADFSGALGLVIGGEGKGISELVKKNCDFLVRIPLRGKIDSLNASVAAAILMYEKVRAEQAHAGK